MKHFAFFSECSQQIKLYCVSFKILNGIKSATTCCPLSELWVLQANPVIWPRPLWKLVIKVFGSDWWVSMRLAFARTWKWWNGFAVYCLVLWFLFTHFCCPFLALATILTSPFGSSGAWGEGSLVVLFSWKDGVQYPFSREGEVSVDFVLPLFARMVSDKRMVSGWVTVTERTEDLHA